MSLDGRNGGGPKFDRCPTVVIDIDRKPIAGRRRTNWARINILIARDSCTNKPSGDGLVQTKNVVHSSEEIY